ncbi:hypothetical protein ASPZODRAFT_66010 [Penicilliopsis zonata CBS 506.65]|uniref:THO complex subunit Tho1 n=1 Tax=Penicilliopsis zonata CBS 506.65 TaxID=1073090 RepID=A0A1L9SGX3_9EURO|nr:hypothetical protein ASPZODRAFT_66010 [Penicilliopsis zonata CBS 506.65]OJJ46373.1 hypothetical protein ASPZODRAFT_66010 [Penicilliopsis zonata CBS 506.65]
MAEVAVDAIPVYRRLIGRLLERAEAAKPVKSIEPPLTESHLGDSIWAVTGEDQAQVDVLSQQARYATVEIAFRENFYSLLATTSIDQPAFIQIWNLLDIISIFSDNEQCEPGLIFWLIEELLDSQTIDSCRKVFDYLESRREQNTKKHFKQKSLIILRSCNELLRRLSRAEDTVFCGRVFIFLFQSFPLGDKSSVNLRGEYHTENVTTFDEIAKLAVQNENIDIDGDEKDLLSTASEPMKVDESQTPIGAGIQVNSQDSGILPKLTVSKVIDGDLTEKVDLNDLYPKFWTLQAYFSAPTKVFDSQHFASFKSGLEATLLTFRNVTTDLEGQGSLRNSEDVRKSAKRKRTMDGAEIASNFNPKYLTSRDLFDLEVSDTAFRRHVLVQALILLDFMLSLTPKAKARLADLTNKSVLYGFVLGEEDAQWATEMRKAIEEYLQEGLGGKFYYRMVDTVLSRDKNWVRWKAEGCPLIERPPVSVKEYLGAREHATKLYANKRLRPSPMGSLDLKFLSEGESTTKFERLKEPDRSDTPNPESFMMGIMDDELDIDMAQSKEDKENATRAKASKIWRMLRLSSRSKLSVFDQIEDGKNIKILFEAPKTATESANTTNEPEQGQANAEEKVEKEGTPADASNTADAQDRSATVT